MSGITGDQLQVLRKALAAIQTLGQGAELKEAPLAGFLNLLTEYQENKAAFVRQLRVKKLVRRDFVGAVMAPESNSQEIADPDLTIIANIKALDIQSLRAALKRKTSENPVWNDLLLLLNQVSPELAVAKAQSDGEKGAKIQKPDSVVFDEGEEGQEGYAMALSLGFEFKGWDRQETEGPKLTPKQEFQEYQRLVSLGFEFKNPGEWVLYKFAIDSHESFRDKGYWTSYKERQREQLRPPRAMEALQLLGDDPLPGTGEPVHMPRVLPMGYIGGGMRRGLSMMLLPNVIQLGADEDSWRQHLGDPQRQQRQQEQQEEQDPALQQAIMASIGGGEEDAEGESKEIRQARVILQGLSRNTSSKRDMDGKGLAEGRLRRAEQPGFAGVKSPAPAASADAAGAGGLRPSATGGHTSAGAGGKRLTSGAVPFGLALAASQPNPWPRRLAWFLFFALSLACTTALVLGAISLATQAAFWIIPAAAAGTVILISAFALLLVLLAGLRYMASAGKSLGGEGGAQPLLPTGGRSDAAPVTLPDPSSRDRLVTSAPSHVGQVGVPGLK